MLSKVTYNNTFVSSKNLEEIKPEMDVGDVGSGLEVCERDPLTEASSDVTIKSEEVIIDSSSYEVSEDPLLETEVSCGPILLKYEVLPFSRDSRPQEELIDSDVSGDQGEFESTSAVIQDSPQVEVPLVEAITHPKNPHCFEKNRPHLTSKGESVADSFTLSIRCSDESIFEKRKNISLSEEVEASSSGTTERLELQRILPGQRMYMETLIQEEKERVRMEQDIGGDGEAWSRTSQEKEGREDLKCFHCGVMFTSKLGLTQHMKEHGFVNSCDFAESGKDFCSNGQFKSHLLTHTESKPYKCAECSKCFSQSGSLKRHMRTHTGLKPYKCAECLKSFSQTSDLKTHMRLHTGSKPYKCSECSKSFHQSGGLERHMRLHTGSKQYICTECSKIFSQSSNLKTHMRLHTGYKPYKCSECSKSFSQNGALKIHMISHTGSKPYKCAECSKCFTQSSNLKTHMRLHTDAKPYKCSECSKSFNLNGSLKRHMKIHTGSKP